MTNLSDREIAEAAAEVGISPAELRQAMAQRNGNLPARIQEQQQGVIAASTRGQVHDFVETQVSAEPSAALAHVRRFVEKQSGKRGHQQGKGQVDIVDDKQGIVYRLRAESDGAQGSIVRVDLDLSVSKARPAYVAMAAPVLGGIASLSMAMILGTLTSPLVWIPFAAMILGSVFWMRKSSSGALEHAREVAQAAVVEASTHEVRALAPPAQ